MKRAGLRALAGSVLETLGWRRAAAPVLLMTAAAVAEGAGVLLLLPLLHLVGIDTSSGAAGELGRTVARAFAAARITPTLATVLPAYVLAVALVATLSYLDSWARARVQHGYVLRLRRRLYASLVGARWAYLARARTAELAQALVGEAERAGRALSFLAYLVSQLLVGAVYVLLALRLSLPVTGVAVAAGVVVTALARRGTQRARQAGEAATRDDADLMEAAATQLDSFKVVKSYGAEDRYLREFERIAERAGANRARAELAFAGARWVAAVGSVVLLAAVLYHMVATLRLPTATVLLLLVVFSRLVPRFSAAQQSWQYLAHELPAVASLLDRMERYERERQPRSGGEARIALREGVGLVGVRFRYDPGAEVLAGIDLHIPAGQITAVVGRSGAGKTTVSDVVAGLLDPTAGRLEIDGQRLGSADGDVWRRSIGYVTQETVIFRDTVRANLAWVRPEATDDELWDALRGAAADEFVARLPHGLDTALGERGSRLSGGERQRLALARALLRDPSLLILDEATSSLDAHSEARVMEAVRGLRGRVTVLLATHRLTPLRAADVIYVVSGGQVVERGTWESLRSSGPRFQELLGEG